MAITGVGNYNNVYENTYVSSINEATKKEETVTKQRSTETTKKSSNEEYLKSLQKQIPYMKLQIGYGVNTKNDGKVDVLDINPKLLEKMQNDPKAAKEYTQRLKDVESAHKYVDNFLKATGSTVICSHAYVDENGNYCNFTVSVRKDALNEKLRKEAQENAEERIEKSREKARENAKLLEENAEEAKQSDKKQERADTGVVEADTVKDKAEKLILEKAEGTKDGEVLLGDEDMQTIIEAVKKDNQGKTDTKKPFAAGTNFDMQI